MSLLVVLRNLLQKKKKVQAASILPMGTLEFVAINTFGTLQKTESRNQFRLLATEVSPSLSKAILTAKSTAITIATILISVSTSNLVIPRKVLAEYGSRMTMKFFRTICVSC